MTLLRRHAMTEAAGRFANAIGLFLVAVYLAGFAIGNAALQWDFKTYLDAARAALAGLDPYRLEHLATIAGRPAMFPFVYAPVALLPFLPFTAWPIAAAALWMGLKIALLAALVVLWRARFAGHAGVLAIALVAVFGWNGAALADLRSGNVALIETALLWSGFACFAAGRRTAFAALVVVASLFKLTPAAFLLLLLVRDREGRTHRATFAIAIAAIVAAVGGPLVVGPASDWSGFLRNLPEASTLGAANPGVLGFITAIVAPWSAPGAGSLASWLWIAYALALLGASVPFLRRAWRDREPVQWVAIAAFLEVLVAPRPMSYGFIHLGPAPFLLAPERLRGRTGALLLAVMLCAQGWLRAAKMESPSIFATYSPFLLTLALWAWIASERSRSGDASRADATPLASTRAAA